MGSDLDKQYLPETDWVEDTADTAASLLSVAAAFCPPLSALAELLKKCVATSLESRCREALNLAAADIRLLEERVQKLEDVINAAKTFVWAFTQENNADKRTYKHALFKYFLQEKSEHPDMKIIDEYETWMRTIDVLSPSAFALLLIFNELSKDKVFQKSTNEEQIVKYKEKVLCQKIMFSDKYKMELFMQGLISNNAALGAMWNSELYFITDEGKAFLSWIESASHETLKI